MVLCRSGLHAEAEVVSRALHRACQSRTGVGGGECVSKLLLLLQRRTTCVLAPRAFYSSATPSPPSPPLLPPPGLPAQLSLTPPESVTHLPAPPHPTPTPVPTLPASVAACSLKRYSLHALALQSLVPFLPPTPLCFITTTPPPAPALKPPWLCPFRRCLC